MPRSGARRRSAACRGRAIRPTSPPSWRTITPAWETPTSSREAWPRPSTSIRRRSRWDPPFTTCGISWDVCCSRRGAPSTRGGISRSSYGGGPTTRGPRGWGGPPAIPRGPAPPPRAGGVASPRAGRTSTGGAAALQVGDYATAVNAYIALGEGDRSRAGEAADGLERTARAALGANDRSDAARGLAGLRAVAPTRPLGRYARLAALDAADRGDTAGAMALLPGAAAAASDPRMTDSLLFVYGMVAVRARACSTAVPVFEGVIRRQREPAVADGAREGLGLCALVEGQRLVAPGKPPEAEDWFRRGPGPRGPPPPGGGGGFGGGGGGASPGGGGGGRAGAPAGAGGGP